MPDLKDILARPAQVLTPAQRDFYFANGYVKVDRFVADAWLRRLWQATDQMVEQGRAMMGRSDVFYFEKNSTPDNPRLQRLTTPDIRHPEYWSFARESNVPDAVADLVGPDVKFHHSKLNFKWALGGQSFDWHQDIVGWPHTNYTPVTVGIYLDDCAREQGPLAVVRGSHEGPLISEYNESGVWTNAIATRDYCWSEDDVDYLTGPAGTAFFLNCRTIHGSARNDSSVCRRLLLYTYTAADAFAYTFNPHQTEHSGQIVRGRPALWAWHDPRPCLVPPDWSKGYEGPFRFQSAQAAVAGDVGKLP
jgi:ectoine hydroxylase